MGTTPVLALLFVIILIPAWYGIKYLEHILQPRKSGSKFLLWLVAVTACAFAWYLVCLYLFFKFFPVKS